MLIRHARLWSSEGPCLRDVRVDGETITAVEEHLEPRAGETTLEGRGLELLPGAIDVHVHVDDTIGRFAIADTFASGSRAALLGGVTTFFTFATERDEDRDLEACVARYHARAQGRVLCDYGLHLTPTRFRAETGDALAGLRERGIRSWKHYTTYRDAGLFVDYARLAAIFARAQRLDVVVLVHAEDDRALDRAAKSPAPLDEPFSHTLRRSPEAEIEAIRRVIALAETSGAKIHVVHVSTAEGAALIEAAKGRCDVSCETGPHYLALDDIKLRGSAGHRYLCTPPLRSPANRERLVDALGRGAFDLLATDHCPFTRADKDTMADDYRTVPNGLAGIGSLLPMTVELVERRGGSLADVVRLLCEGPAQRFGLTGRKGVIAPGADADLVLLERHEAPRPLRSTASDCYETFAGMTTTCAMRYVILRGTVVVENDALSSPATPQGRFLWPQS